MPPAPKPKRVRLADGSFRVAGRNSTGSGSVYFVPERGVYKATYTVPGERRPRTVSGKTKAEAEARRREKLAEIEAAGKPSRFDRSTTVGQLSVWWLDHIAAHRVRPSTLAKYRERLRDDRLGRLADVPVVDLRADEVTVWQSELLSAGLVASTVRDLRSTLRQVLATAVDHGLVVVNPVERTKPPKAVKRPGRALTPDEVRALLITADRYRYGPVVALLFVQGWRVSEVLGLAWDDVDLDGGIATVRRAVVEVSGSGRHLGPTKTDGAHGQHRLASGVVERLRRWRAVQAAERLAAGPVWETHTYEGREVSLVFTKADGGLVARQHVDKLIRQAACEAGISDTSRLGTHVGRRSVVTGLYVQGVELGDVARHVGHASPSTTAGYVADLGERPRRTAQLAADLFDAPPAAQ